MAAVLGALRRKAPPLAPAGEPEEVDFPVYAFDDVAQDLLRDGIGRRIAVFGVAAGTDTSWTALKFARELAVDARVVLVGIDSADTAILAASNDPSAGGLAELADGTASFGDIITRDRQSGLHLISSGRVVAERGEIVLSPAMATTFDALARSYEYVVVAAGAVVGPELEVIGAMAPHAMLVVEEAPDAGASAARERLLDAGFDDVTVVAGLLQNDLAEAAAAA
jgi:Mrp family chromosome partitioning ATPase